MKINWGTGIVIAMAVFMSFILYFVLQMVISSAYDPEMVTEDYYQKEYVFQQEIDAIQNGNALKDNVKINKEGNAFSVIFPQEFNYEEISGTIYMYRPSDKNLDIEIPIKLDASSYIIPNEQLAEGKWQISIDWQYHDKNYLYKKTIYN